MKAADRSEVTGFTAVWSVERMGLGSSMVMSVADI